MYNKINDSIHMLIDNTTETNISKVIKQQNIQYLLFRFNGTNSTSISLDDLTGKITVKGECSIDNIPFNELNKMTDGFMGYARAKEGTTFDFVALLPVNCRNYSGNMYLEISNFNDTDEHRIRVDAITSILLDNPIEMSFLQESISGTTSKLYDLGYTPYIFIDASDSSKIGNISITGNITKTSYVNKDFDTLNLLSNITHRIETDKSFIILDVSNMLVNREPLTVRINTIGATDIKLISFGNIIYNPEDSNIHMQEPDTKY